MNKSSVSRPITIRAAFLASALGQYSIFLISFISTVVYARLLSPTEIGVFAVASSIIVLISEVQQLGTGAYIVRKESISRADVSSGLGLMVLMCMTIGLSAYTLSSNIEDFYNIDGLAMLIEILCLSFLTAPFISISSAVLSRDLQFKKLMAVRTCSAIFKFGCCTFLILENFSYSSLAFGYITGSVLEFILFFLLKTKDATWIPSFKGIKPIFWFGINASITNLLVRLNTTVPDLIIGKSGTVEQVAFFSRGQGLLNFITMALTKGMRPVALPYLSRTLRDGGDIIHSYVKATNLYTGIVCPALITCGLASYPLINFIFGEQWIQSAKLALIISFGAVIQATIVFANVLLIAKARETFMLFKQIVVTAILLIGITVGFNFGLQGVAWGLLVTSIMEFIITALFLKYSIKLHLMRLFDGLKSSLLLTLICGLTTILLDFLIDFQNPNSGLILLITALTITVTWLISLFIFKHPLGKEISSLALRYCKK